MKNNKIYKMYLPSEMDLFMKNKRGKESYKNHAERVKGSDKNWSSRLHNHPLNVVCYPRAYYALHLTMSAWLLFWSQMINFRVKLI